MSHSCSLSVIRRFRLINQHRDQINVQASKVPDITGRVSVGPQWIYLYTDESTRRFLWKNCNCIMLMLTLECTEKNDLMIHDEGTF